MTVPEQQVSHNDLYHKLGKLEGLMETMMASVSAFQTAIKDVHSRIDTLERRQTVLEKQQSSSRGSFSALTSAAKDFALPIMAITVTWLVASTKQYDSRKDALHPSTTPRPEYRSEYRPEKPHQPNVP